MFEIHRPDIARAYRVAIGVAKIIRRTIRDALTINGIYNRFARKRFMLSRKSQVTYCRLEEIVVEVDATNEAEARSEAFDFVRGKGAGKRS